MVHAAHHNEIDTGTVETICREKIKNNIKRCANIPFWVAHFQKQLSVLEAFTRCTIKDTKLEMVNTFK